MWHEEVFCKGLNEPVLKIMELKYVAFPWCVSEGAYI